MSPNIVSPSQKNHKAKAVHAFSTWLPAISENQIDLLIDIYRSIDNDRFMLLLDVLGLASSSAFHISDIRAKKIICALGPIIKESRATRRIESKK